MHKIYRFLGRKIIKLPSNLLLQKADVRSLLIRWRKEQLRTNTVAFTPTKHMRSYRAKCDIV